MPVVAEKQCGLRRFAVAAFVEAERRPTSNGMDRFLCYKKADEFAICPHVAIQEAAYKINSTEFMHMKRLKSIENGVLHPYVDVAFFSSYNSVGEASRLVTSDDCVNNFNAKILLQKACYEELQLVDPKRDMIQTPIDEQPARPYDSNQDKDSPDKELSRHLRGYIIVAYKTMEDMYNREFVNSWKTWTGVRYICMMLPRQLALRRISFYRQVANTSSFTYLLAIEITNLQLYSAQTLNLVDRIRPRLCGYVGVYREVDFKLDPVTAQNLELDVDYKPPPGKSTISVSRYASREKLLSEGDDMTNSAKKRLQKLLEGKKVQQHSISIDEEDVISPPKQSTPEEKPAIVKTFFKIDESGAETNEKEDAKGTGTTVPTFSFPLPPQAEEKGGKPPALLHQQQQQQHTVTQKTSVESASADETKTALRQRERKPKKEKPMRSLMELAKLRNQKSEERRKRSAASGGTVTESEDSAKESAASSRPRSATGQPVAAQRRKASPASTASSPTPTVRLAGQGRIYKLGESASTVAAAKPNQAKVKAQTAPPPPPRHFVRAPRVEQLSRGSVGSSLSSPPQKAPEQQPTKKPDYESVFAKRAEPGKTTTVDFTTLAASMQLNGRDPQEQREQKQQQQKLPKAAADETNQYNSPVFSRGDWKKGSQLFSEGSQESIESFSKALEKMRQTELQQRRLSAQRLLLLKSADDLDLQQEEQHRRHQHHQQQRKGGRYAQHSAASQIEKLRATLVEQRRRTAGSLSDLYERRSVPKELSKAQFQVNVPQPLETSMFYQQELAPRFHRKRQSIAASEEALMREEIQANLRRQRQRQPRAGSLVNVDFTLNKQVVAPQQQQQAQQQRRRALPPTPMP